MPSASIGASAGPLRVSQNIGCGALLAPITAAPIIGALLFVGWAHGLTVTAQTTLTQDGHYVAASAPEDMKIEAGTYTTTTPEWPREDDGAKVDKASVKRDNDETRRDYRCRYSVSEGSDGPDRVSEGWVGKPIPFGAKVTVTIERGEHFYTFGCGTWTKVS